MVSALYPLHARCVAGTGVGSFPGDLKITSSSNLKEKNKVYLPGFTIDYDYNTAWCEGKPDNGIGEWIEYKFSPTSFLCGEIIIMPGITKSLSLYSKNNRIKDMEILVTYSNGYSFKDNFTLPDNLCTNLEYYCKLTDEAQTEHYGFEELPYSKCMKKYAGLCVPPILETPHGPNFPGFGYYNEKLSLNGITSLKFTIKSVYKGSEYNDTCISEIFPMGILD